MYIIIWSKKLKSPDFFPTIEVQCAVAQSGRNVPIPDIHCIPFSGYHLTETVSQDWLKLTRGMANCTYSEIGDNPDPDIIHPLPKTPSDRRHCLTG